MILSVEYLAPISEGGRTNVPVPGVMTHFTSTLNTTDIDTFNGKNHEQNEESDAEALLR